MNENDRMWVLGLFALLLEFLIFSNFRSWRSAEKMSKTMFLLQEKKLSRNEIVYVFV